MVESIQSWGRAHKYSHKIKRLQSDGLLDLQEIASASKTKTVLAHGMGRSYGDSNLNNEGSLVITTRANRILHVDWTAGILRAEAGLTIDELLQVSVPKGWFVHVTPGSKFVTLGGAVANDVHGKNHHNTGSFGSSVRALGLQRSDRLNSAEAPIICSSKKRSKLFEMTLGGLGLTGLIRWVELQLKPISSAYLKVENIRYDTLDEFFEISQSSSKWDYTVAWVDCFAKKGKLGRGIFTRAKFTDDGALKPHEVDSKLTFPFSMPTFLLNKMTISMFNWLYRKRPGANYSGFMHYDDFFYPLDGILHWNRLYGRTGFFQHQSLFELDVADEGIRELLKAIEASGQGSFLAVLKVHGPEISPGVMSFCKQGVSLALDFSNRGQKTLSLLDHLDEIVAKYHGRTYPAKDGRMSSTFYKSSYPKWEALEKARDPIIMSSFWRRVLQTKHDVSG